MNTEEQERFLSLLKEYRAKRVKRTKKARTFLLVVEYVLMFGGFFMIGYQNIWIAIGLYLVIFSNNMGVFRTLGKKGLKIFEDIWKE
jgi:hypothetical protein